MIQLPPLGSHRGTVNSSGATVPAGEGSYTWTGLTPGRTYVFYVRDNTGCVRQSLVNVNDLIVEPITITTEITPTCFGSSTGEIEYTITPTTAYSHMRWEFFEVGNSTALQTSGGNILYNNTINVTGLPEGNYYIEIVQSDGTTDSCTGGSENTYVPELRVLDATATATRDISCNLP
ncbi:hypothetical protein [Zobellia laminariae]|uniref:hypothetical protein n=1 Tax=Zobellia laminariae TaxID=248906 RepID=UPI0026F44D02|nr:hypothetical protein [Zobellia laminariae]WKX77947.1 hypothetical protein Q5W13_08410 [Zobellia laminariae]